MKGQVYVNSTQLRKAAALIVEAEPTVANGIAAERPAWLAPDPAGDDAVVLQIGILPTTEYLLFRTGRVSKKRGG